MKTFAQKITIIIAIIILPVEIISNYLFLWVCFVTYKFSSLLHPVKKTLKNSLKKKIKKNTEVG
jgi:hypothetical protein